ncbi:MAG: FMN-binding negative transcriptional regulator [Gemmatimonadaceae bacterium]|nr:FMN-binding negative transcriptional regulator [Chitinophagaceae bacterium]
MYSLPEYKEADHRVVVDFMKEHPFVFLSGTNADGKPVATQLPVLIEEREGKIILHGHLMKQTDHHKAFVHNDNALAVFTGPHTYVSASLYTDKHTGSTWNYMSVHAAGKIKFLGDEALLDLLTKLTEHFENNPYSPSLVKDLPKEYMDRLMKAILAFEIEVTSLENVFKLSQNRDEQSYDAIIDHLRSKGGDPALIASEMEKRRSQLFKTALPQ